MSSASQWTMLDNAFDLLDQESLTCEDLVNPILPAMFMEDFESNLFDFENLTSFTTSYDSIACNMLMIVCLILMIRVRMLSIHRLKCTIP